LYLNPFSNRLSKLASKIPCSSSLILHSLGLARQVRLPMPIARVWRSLPTSGHCFPALGSLFPRRLAVIVDLRTHTVVVAVSTATYTNTAIATTGTHRQSHVQEWMMARLVCFCCLLDALRSCNTLLCFLHHSDFKMEIDWRSIQDGDGKQKSDGFCLNLL
jgi:hypothetical protein